MALCACGHSSNIHSDSGPNECAMPGCGCIGFVWSDAKTPQQRRFEAIVSGTPPRVPAFTKDAVRLPPCPQCGGRSLEVPPARKAEADQLRFSVVTDQGRGDYCEWLRGVLWCPRCKFNEPGLRTATEAAMAAELEERAQVKRREREELLRLAGIDPGLRRALTEQLKSAEKVQDAERVRVEERLMREAAGRNTRDRIPALRPNVGGRQVEYVDPSTGRVRARGWIEALNEEKARVLVSRQFRAEFRAGDFLIEGDDTAGAYTEPAPAPAVDVRRASARALDVAEALPEASAPARGPARGTLDLEDDE